MAMGDGDLPDLPASPPANRYLPTPSRSPLDQPSHPHPFGRPADGGGLDLQLGGVPTCTWWRAPFFSVFPKILEAILLYQFNKKIDSSSTETRVEGNFVCAPAADHRPCAQVVSRPPASASTCLGLPLL